MTAAPDPAARALAPSTLLYLFADRFVPREQPGKSGQVCWSTGQVVQTKTLAVRLPMAALIGLRVAGVVKLVAYKEKKLMITTRGVRAVLVGTAPPLSGVEQKLAGALERDRNVRERGASVGFALDGLVRNSKNPYGAIIQWAIDDAVTAGYLLRVPVERGVGGVLTHQSKTKLEPVADRIAGLRPACEEFVQRWNAVYDDERALYDELQRTFVEDLQRRERSWDD